MFKSVHNKVWAFDVEWVPDPVAGRLVHELPADMPDADVIAKMWEKGGATEEDPRPFLKTVLCRVVSISMVLRHCSKESGETKLGLRSIPQIGETLEENKRETRIVGDFLEAVGKNKPQVVGYNSVRADLKILIQRAVTNGLSVPLFARRPDKPWEGADYFSDFSEWNVDLMKIVGGNRSTPSLNEMARLSAIPGKMGVDGNEVAPMWLEGRIDDIVRYNEFDALTTYLLWLRFAHFGGFFDDEDYGKEQKLVREMIEKEIASGRKHLEKYIEEWDRLRSFVL